MPDDDRVKCDVLPVLRQIDQIANRAYRCRVVNRAFRSVMGPAEIEALLPDEDIDLLAELDQADQLDDEIAYLKLLLRLPQR